MANKFEETFTNIADAIREKSGTTDKIKPEDMANKISAISSGGMKTYFDLLPDQGYYFYDNPKLTDNILNQLLKYNDTENVTNMRCAFKTDNAIASVTQSSYITTIPLLNTSKVINMSDMFWGCSELTTIPQLDTSSVTTMHTMFSGCYQLQSIPLLNTSEVTDMYEMFYHCWELIEIPKLNTGKVITMYGTFGDCRKITTIPLLDTNNVIDMERMFDYCYALTTIPELNTNKVTTMREMFEDCSLLEKVPLLNTSNVVNMYRMFANCSNLKSIPSFDISNVTDMGGMFVNCSSLEEIHMTGMKVSFGISSSTKFTESALVEILNNLEIVSTTQILTMGSANLAKLADEEKQIATDKGWILA